MEFDPKLSCFVGTGGKLPVSAEDEIARRLAMLIEGECSTRKPTKVAKKFGYCRQRYFQLRTAFRERGALGLVSQKRGPKSNHRRTSEVVAQAIRHRMLDPDASSDVIAQKLRQCGFKISKRSVDRIFEEFGLQKKTVHIPPGS